MIRTDRYSGTKGNFQDFCIQCEQDQHDQNADKFCVEMGLLTTRQKIDFCRLMAKRMFPNLSFKALPDDRVPGEDDEREAA